MLLYYSSNTKEDIFAASRNIFLVYESIFKSVYLRPEIRPKVWGKNIAERKNKKEERYERTRGGKRYLQGLQSGRK